MEEPILHQKGASGIIAEYVCVYCLAKKLGDAANVDAAA